MRDPRHLHPHRPRPSGPSSGRATSANSPREPRLGVRRGLRVVTTPSRRPSAPPSPGCLSDRPERVRNSNSRGEADVYPHAVMHVPGAVADRAVGGAARGHRCGWRGRRGRGVVDRTGRSERPADRTAAAGRPDHLSRSGIVLRLGPHPGQPQRTTGRDPRVQARTVVYDPDLTSGFPVPLSSAQRAQRTGPRGRGALRARHVTGRGAAGGRSRTVAGGGTSRRRGRSPGRRGDAAARPLRCLAGRQLPRRDRHVTAPQALPRARREASICRTPRPTPWCCHVLRYNLPAARRADTVLRRALGTADVASPSTN